jgi:hypothetical protein
MRQWTSRFKAQRNEPTRQKGRHRLSTLTGIGVAGGQL